jgi:hypothetical protein
VSSSGRASLRLPHAGRERRRAAAIAALTLDGKTLTANVANAIQDIPYERSIEGASTVNLMLIDPDGDLLDSGLFSAAVDIELPAPVGHPARPGPARAIRRLARLPARVDQVACGRPEPPI